jgi:hypothetical protein
VSGGVEVIVDVAEELRELVADLEVVAALEPFEWAEERVHGAVEVGRLAAQDVDPLGRRR